MMIRAIATLAVLAMVAAGCGGRVNDTATQAGQVSAGQGPSGVGDASGELPDELGQSPVGGGPSAGATPESGAAEGGPAGGPAGGPTPAGADESDDGPSDPGVTDTEIRIGLTGPLAGLGGDIFGVEAVGALQAYFNMVNERGGINGRKLRLIAYDNRTDFSQDATNARRLYEKDKVIAMATTIPDAMADYVTRNEIPTFALGFSGPAFSSRYPTVYPVLQSGASAIYAMAWALREAGVIKPGARIGITTSTEFISTGEYLPQSRDAWAMAGAEVVGHFTNNLSSGDCTATVNKMADLNIDWWDFEDIGWILCVSAAQRLGYKPKVGWGGFPTQIGALAQQAGPWVDGVWLMAPADEPNGYPRGMSPGIQQYMDALQRFQPKLAEVPHSNSVVTQTYWIVGAVLEAALKAQGRRITKAGLNQYLQGIKNFDTGISPPLETWDPKCKVGVNQIWLGQWKWENDAPRREGKTNYITNPKAEEKYGKCYVTALADEAVSRR